MLYEDETFIFESERNSAKMADKLEHDLAILAYFFTGKNLIVNLKK